MVELQQQLGHVFSNPDLLRQALTHVSCGKVNNERMEFIGDSLLNMAAAVLLYENFPTLPEGNLSRVRAGIVCQNTLVIVGERIGLKKHLRIEHHDGTSTAHPAIIADAMEALFGAIYLDAGINKAIQVLRKHITEVLNNGESVLKKDPKTSLQEYLQGKGLPLPQYSLVGDRVKNAPLTKAACSIPALKIHTVGEGVTKKNAEADAANKALALCHRN